VEISLKIIRSSNNYKLITTIFSDRFIRIIYTRTDFHYVKLVSYSHRCHVSNFLTYKNFHTAFLMPNSNVHYLVLPNQMLITGFTRPLRLLCYILQKETP